MRYVVGIACVPDRGNIMVHETGADTRDKLKAEGAPILVIKSGRCICEITRCIWFGISRAKGTMHGPFDPCQLAYLRVFCKELGKGAIKSCTHIVKRPATGGINDDMVRCSLVKHVVADPARRPFECIHQRFDQCCAVVVSINGQAGAELRRRSLKRIGVFGEQTRHELILPFGERDHDTACRAS